MRDLVIDALFVLFWCAVFLARRAAAPLFFLLAFLLGLAIGFRL